MTSLTSLIIVVMGNVISHYVIKWFDDNKNGNEPEQRR